MSSFGHYDTAKADSNTTQGCRMAQQKAADPQTKTATETWHGIPVGSMHFPPKLEIENDELRRKVDELSCKILDLEKRAVSAESSRKMAHEDMVRAEERSAVDEKARLNAAKSCEHWMEQARRLEQMLSQERSKIARLQKRWQEASTSTIRGARPNLAIIDDHNFVGDSDMTQLDRRLLKAAADSAFAQAVVDEADRLRSLIKDQATKGQRKFVLAVDESPIVRTAVQNLQDEVRITMRRPWYLFAKKIVRVNLNRKPRGGAGLFRRLFRFLGYAGPWALVGVYAAKEAGMFSDTLTTL